MRFICFVVSLPVVLIFSLLVVPFFISECLGTLLIKGIIDLDNFDLIVVPPYVFEVLGVMFYLAIFLL